MQKPFEVTPEMMSEVDDEIAKALKQTPHDPAGAVAGPPRIRRGTVDLVDSDGAESRSSYDIQTDPVNHPKHYTNHPSGIECITITEWMTFNLGNAVKYIWRCADKGYKIEDLKKARWYIDRELKRLGE
jgi:Protein of unknwon function (DUF3310)